MSDVQVLRDEADKEQFDASVVLGKKPGKHYRWGRNDPKNLLMRRLEGYDVCHDPDVKSALGEDTRIKKGGDVDDTITFGDLILLETSQENHQRLVDKEHAKIARRTSGVMDNFNNTVRRATGQEPIMEHHVPASREGKGYDRGVTADELQRTLDNDPMSEKGNIDIPDWRNRKE